MNAINIPFNVRVKVNKTSRNKPYPLGTFTLQAKHMPQSTMLFFASFRLFIMAVQALFKME